MWPGFRDPKELMQGALTGVAQLVGVSSCKSKGLGFNSWSGHMPKLQIWSLAEA